MYAHYRFAEDYNDAYFCKVKSENSVDHIAPSRELILHWKNLIFFQQSCLS